MSLFGIIKCQEISWVTWLVELETIAAPCKAEKDLSQGHSVSVKSKFH